MKFHLCHVIPDPQIHGLLGYAEVIESIRWGLSELGHSVSAAINTRVEDAVNIIFGAQMLTPDQVQQLPRRTVIYNFEQIANAPIDKLRPALVAAARSCRIWDYDPANIETWKKLEPVAEPVLVPIGWAPTLERIPQLAEEDREIEILMYGTPVESRMRVVWQLGDHNYRIVFASGVYGRLRDDLIARSKLVVNVNRYPRHRAFEIVRVSYLLGNGRAVVSDYHPEYRIDEELRRAVAFAAPDKVVAMCERLIASLAERQEFERAGAAVMRKRDIRTILAAPVAALDALG